MFRRVQAAEVQHAPALFLADTLGPGFVNSFATLFDTEIDRIEDGDDGDGDGAP
ncbi:hypothetical protein [Streptomyces sp. NPDC056672]|uniref:hypothetical protein n=1 Tax=Streptomyces sp. NPDC056672 TaxID=3345906 RepID=UPI00369376C8